MGTRNLTMVIDQNGNKKIAQYGQWDGYPSGQGATVLNFFRDKENVQKLIDKLPIVRFLEFDGRDKEFIDNYNSNTSKWSNEPDNRTPEQIQWFKTYMTRDLGAMILYSVINSNDAEILLLDQEYTAKSTINHRSMIEWTYVVNLQENKLKVHSTLDFPPIKEYDLDNLPDLETFINDFNDEEE